MAELWRSRLGACSALLEALLGSDELSAQARSALRSAGLLDAGVLEDLSLEGDAAFTGYLESVIGSLPTYVEDRALLVGRVAAAARDAAAKRRRLFATAPLNVAALYGVFTSAAASGLVAPGAPSDVPLPAVPLGRPLRWPSRLRRAAAAEQGLAVAEEAERQRLIGQVVAALRASHAPVVEIADASLDPDGVLRRAVGGLRARTVRQRLRAFSKYQKWLFAAGLPAWPTGAAGVRAALHFLDELVAGGCARSAPRSFLSGIRFYERVGGVADGIGGVQLLEATVKEYQINLSRGRLQPRRKAPIYPVALIVSLELTVVLESFPRYKRVYAWAKLVRVWGGLRFDDLMHIAPADLHLRGEFLEGAIWSSKTTGAGRKVEVLHLYVSRHAFVAVPRWLEVGFQLLSDMAGPLARDYLLPMPDSMLEGVRATPVK